MSDPTQIALSFEDVREAKLELAFRTFHRANPHVDRMLRTLARRWKDAGKSHLGIGMLWEVMRWQMAFEVSDQEFKLNNNPRSRYARLLMTQEPDLEGIFETRTLTSEEDDP